MVPLGYVLLKTGLGETPQTQLDAARFTRTSPITSHYPPYGALAGVIDPLSQHLSNIPTIAATGGHNGYFAYL